MIEIAIITIWYNEEVLAPFFLKHYSYVDDIFVYLDTDTDDGTRGICEAHSNVTVREIAFPNGYDPIVHTDQLNSVVRELEHSWVYAVDADEFIQQPKEYKDAREFLLKQERDYNLVYAQMYQVYRHATDEDLDISKPVLPQRCHGDPSLDTVFNRCYIKPIVVKPETGITWTPGCHAYHDGLNVVRAAEERFFGAHWKMADDSFAIERRIYHNQARLSGRSRAGRMVWQDIDATEESILGDLEKHRHDPNVLGSF